VAEDFENVYLHIQAQQALIAALAESGRLEEAWRECLDLESLLTDHVDEDTAGKAYWVIGNVAFLSNRVNEGSHYHDLAAGQLSPSKDVDLWARFNRGSAEMRLHAQLGDAATLRCIERAELATDVIGGSANDYLLMRLNRGHWSFLAGDSGTAIELLQAVCADADTTLPQILGEARLLLGRAFSASRNPKAARENLLLAADHFEASGAQQRADQAREYLTTEV
jgi:hypothetical protein